MKKKTIKNIIIIVVCLISGFYLGFKGYLLYICRLDPMVNEEVFQEFVKMYDIKETKRIDGINTNEDYARVDINELSIKDVFSGYEMTREDNDLGTMVSYNKFDEGKNNLKASIRISIEKTWVDLYKEDYTLLGGDDSSTIMGNKETRNEFLEKNKITTEAEFYKFLLDHKEYKANIFTSAKEIINMHDIYMFGNIILSIPKEAAKLEGVYEGYYSKPSDKWQSYVIYKNNKKYSISFLGSEYTEEFIESVMNSINIKEA